MSRLLQIGRRLVAHRTTALAALPLVGFAVLGLCSVWLMPADPYATELAATLQAPSGEHLLGTDHLGRDQLSRLLQAARVSLMLTAAVLLVSMALGVVVGVTAGYLGGVLDRTLTGLVDLTMAVPGLLVALAVIGVRGPGVASIVLALALVGWAPYARIARAQIRTDRSAVHVDALRVLGAPRRRIVALHLLPGALGPCLVYASTDLGAVVLAIASLSFLGLGVPPPQAEWGAMLVEARPYLDSAWWLALPPGIVISAVVFAANLLGERLAADAAKPSQLIIGSRRANRYPQRPARAGRAGLSVCSLGVRYGERPVVAGVSLDLLPGEILALVGETGSGKSSIALAAIGLLGPTATVTGSAVLRTPTGDHELVGTPRLPVPQVHGQEVGVVLQDSLGALNPLRTVASSLDQAIRWASPPDHDAVRIRRDELLQEVGMQHAAHLYPHQLSGGMRQRCQIAIAMAGRPRVLIADEPTSALDASVRAGILQLLRRFRDDQGGAVLIVTHDLGVAADLADSVAVAYAGRIVEHGPAGRVLTQPDHPYTRGLLAAVPNLDVAPRTPFVTLLGQPAAGLSETEGCAFAPRCQLAQPQCGIEEAALEHLGEEHWSGCRRHPSGRLGRLVAAAARA